MLNLHIHINIHIYACACACTRAQVMLNQIKQESKVRVQNITADGKLAVTKLDQEYAHVEYV